MRKYVYIAIFSCLVGCLLYLYDYFPLENYGKVSIISPILAIASLILLKFWKREFAIFSLSPIYLFGFFVFPIFWKANGLFLLLPFAAGIFGLKLYVKEKDPKFFLYSLASFLSYFSPIFALASIPLLKEMIERKESYKECGLSLFLLGDSLSSSIAFSLLGVFLIAMLEVLYSLTPEKKEKIFFFLSFILSGVSIFQLNFPDLLILNLIKERKPAIITHQELINYFNLPSPENASSYYIDLVFLYQQKENSTEIFRIVYENATHILAENKRFFLSINKDEKLGEITNKENGITKPINYLDVFKFEHFVVLANEETYERWKNAEEVYPDLVLVEK